MLIIRKEQMKVFGIISLDYLEKQLVHHISTFAPKVYTISDKDIVHRIVKIGINQAMHYGFSNRGPIRLFIEHMFMFGTYFDTDLQYRWAHETLTDNTIIDQMERADRLYKKMLIYRKKVAGMDCKNEKKALLRILQSALEDLPDKQNNFNNDMVEYLDALYPEKSRFIGKSAIGRLIQQGKLYAIDNSINCFKGLSLFIIIMFSFGHRCFEDLQFSWIRNTLENQSTLEQKIERLKSKAITYFKHVQAGIEKKDKCH